MSDIRSVQSFVEFTKAKKAEERLVDANAVLQKALQQINAEDRGKIILRCDDLPSFQGHKDDLQTVFTSILNLILQKRKAVSQLFLHIHCLEETKSLMSSLEVQRFNIQFKTNITPCVEWLQLHEQQINQLGAIRQKNYSSLTVNQLLNGCIFSVSVPGKTF